jgi:hypothetical protein
MLLSQVGVWTNGTFNTVDKRGNLSWIDYVWVGPLAVFKLDAGQHNIVLCIDQGDANIDKFK